MTTRPDGRRVAPAKPSALAWWLALSPSLAWRLPLFLILAAGGALYAFRALAHLSFLVVSNLLVTFLAAPLLLPFAAVPALCFLLLIRLLPHLWRRGALSAGRRALLTAVAPLASFILAYVVDFLQIVMLQQLGTRVPRLPFDPY